MKKVMIGLACVALLLAAPHTSFAQYFQSLFDNDSTIDWGLCLYNKPDSNYFVVAWSQKGVQLSLFDMTISADGQNQLGKNDITISGKRLYIGDAGQMRHLSGGGYILPFNEQWPNPSTGYLHSSAGLLKLNEAGGTVFLKTYTDTSIYFDSFGDVSVMPDKGYLLCGSHSLNTPSNYPAYIIRTDSMGDTVWTHTYQKDTAEPATIFTIDTLGGGRILAGAGSEHTEWDGSISYLGYSVWFMVLDGMGNVIKDTVYGSKYGGGGQIFNDINGGYFHFGEIDTFETSDPSDYNNFPDYFAHLDTNFHIQWITRFPYDYALGHRYIFKAIALHDGNYLVEGDAGTYTFGYILAWAAKVSKNGDIMWSNYYLSDSMHNSYFRDVVEMPNGNLVFTGAAFNDTIPAWREVQDMWLVGTDSNGCVTDGCLTTRVPTSPSLSYGELTVYPNPATRMLNFQYSLLNNVRIKLIDVTGRVMDEQALQNSSTASFNVSRYTPGIYLYQFITDSGVQSGKVIVE